MNICAKCNFVKQSEVITDWKKYYCECKTSDCFCYEVSANKSACHLFAEKEIIKEPVKLKKQMDITDDEWIFQTEKEAEY